MSAAERPDFALELMVACTRPTYLGPLDQLARTRSFPTLLDSGDNGWGSMSQRHFEEYCEPREDFDELDRRRVGLANGLMVEAPIWYCDIWLYPEGVRPDIAAPLEVYLGHGLTVFPKPCDGSTLGMLSLRQLRARLDIDFDREVSSVLIPASVARQSNAGA